MLSGELKYAPVEIIRHLFQEHVVKAIPTLDENDHLRWVLDAGELKFFATAADLAIAFVLLSSRTVMEHRLEIDRDS